MSLQFSLHTTRDGRYINFLSSSSLTNFQFLTIISKLTKSQVVTLIINNLRAGEKPFLLVNHFSAAISKFIPTINSYFDLKLRS